MTLLAKVVMSICPSTTLLTLTTPVFNQFSRLVSSLASLSTFCILAIDFAISLISSLPSTPTWVSNSSAAMRSVAAITLPILAIVTLI